MPANNYLSTNQPIKCVFYYHLFNSIGINIANMEKTEKSMVELELELNQKSEWFTLQESGGTLRPINGPGYTGMANLGNSCYMNSVIQMIFIVPDFIRKYFENSNTFFEKAEDPPNDFNVQM